MKWMAEQKSLPEKNEQKMNKNRLSRKKIAYFKISVKNRISVLNFSLFLGKKKSILNRRM